MSAPPHGAGRRVAAVVLAVGSELLTPTRIDTNSLAITAILNELGIDVVDKGVVGDDRRRIGAHVLAALARAELVVVTGGLGPTDDDVTREGVADALELPLVEDADVLAAIARRFADRGMRMPDVNRRQARVPHGAVVLANPGGTAPGLWLEREGRAVVLLPGPTREMRPMLERLAADRLSALSGGTRIHRRVLKIAGRSESAVEERVQPLYSTWLDGPYPIETTILAAQGQVELHLTLRDGDEDRARVALDRAVAGLDALMGADVFSHDASGLEAVVGDALRARQWRIALAESCTGGLVTSRLTDVPGSSDYVERTIVAYSNQAKMDLLGVPETLLAEHGAVSELVARAMAEGVRNRAGVDVGVGITGIAGPGGATPGKPVGTVCIAVVLAVPSGGGEPATRVRTFHFRGDRALVKGMAATSALDMLRRGMMEDGTA